MSRIVRFHELGGPDVLRIDEVDVPPPGPGEARIAVKAIGLNRAEAMFRIGEYEAPKEMPSRIGYEAAGVVEEVGAGANGFAPGDEVSVIPTAGGIGTYGTYGEVAIVPVSSLVKHPSSLSFIEAGAAWMQYLTAYGALVDRAALKKGDVVVINAASSSVGLAAIQIANLVGAVPVAATRTSAKREALLRAGARHVIATREVDFAKAVLEITNGEGARVVFDPVGGSAVETFVNALAPHGLIVLYGILDPGTIKLPTTDFLFKALTLTTFRVADLTLDPDRLDRAMRFVLDGLRSQNLNAIVDKIFTLDQIVDAHRHLESNEQFGKIVVTV